MTFEKQIWVIKIGGAILHNLQALTAFLSTLKTIQQANEVAIVLVHGGGIVVDQMLANAGFTTEKLNGLRVTPKEQIPLISGALAGSVNKFIVAQSQALGINAVGLSLVDGNSTICQPANVKLGNVGLPQGANPALLKLLLANQFMPVLSSIGALSDGELVNVNADDAAVALCQLLAAELVLLTDVSGVRDANGNTLASLSAEQADNLIENGVINGGMIAKVKAALLAANHLRRSIAVASWDKPEQLLQLLGGESTGTRILPN